MKKLYFPNVSMASTWKKLSLTLLLAVAGSGAAVSQDLADHVVISEVSGGAGNEGSPYNTDYIELYNPTANDIVMTNWSVQYAAPGGENWAVFDFSGTIKAHGYFLIAGFNGIGNAPLPGSDYSNQSLSLPGRRSKVVLVNNATVVSGQNPTSANIIDKVGWGNDGANTATGFEGTMPLATINSNEALERKAFATSTAASMATGGADALQGNGYDSDNNQNDFLVVAPNPQWSGSPIERPTVSGLDEDFAAGGIPRAFVLSSLLPNPVQNQGLVRFGLPQASAVKLVLYSNTGAVVREQGLGNFSAGYHEVAWYSAQEKELNAGTYILRLVSAHGAVSGRVVISK